MSNKDKLNQEIINFYEARQEITNKLKEFINDKQNSINDRWEIFVSSNLAETSHYLVNFSFGLRDIDNFINDFIYTDSERNSTLYVNDIIESLEIPYRLEPRMRYNTAERRREEIPGEFGPYGVFGRPFTKTGDDGDETVVFGQEHIDMFKEQCMNLFIDKIIYDW